MAACFWTSGGTGTTIGYGWTEPCTPDQNILCCAIAISLGENVNYLSTHEAVDKSRILPLKPLDQAEFEAWKSSASEIQLRWVEGGHPDAIDTLDISWLDEDGSTPITVTYSRARLW